MAWRRITDKQWKAIEPHLPKRKRSRKGGRPPANDRKCFEGILWILWTGAPWSDEQSENQLPKDNRTPVSIFRKSKRSNMQNRLGESGDLCLLSTRHERRACCVIGKVYSI